MRGNHGIIVLTAALSFFAFNCTANAAVLDHIVFGPNSGSDENREYLIDNVFTATGQIDVGDAFRGHINFNTLNDASANLGGATGENELSGIFQVIVLSKVAIGGGQFAFTFGPDPTFAEGAGTLGGLPMIVLWEDTTPDYAGDFDDPSAGGLALLPDDGTAHLPPHGIAGPPHTPPSSADVSVGPYVTENAFIATAGDGTRFITLGFAGAAGEGFFATGLDNVLGFFGFTSGTAGANNNFSMSRLDGPGAETADVLTFGPTVGLFGAINGIVGSQQLRGVADLDTSFEISSNTNISFNVVGVIPEPASVLVWLGLTTAVGLAMRAWHNVGAERRA
jgi:hypothetical protein